MADNTELTNPNLNAKQMLFCAEYVKDFNATQAAIRAGYSELAASEQGSRLLTFAKINNQINKLQERRAKRLDIDADWVLCEIQKTLVNSNDPTTDYYDPSSALKAADLLGKYLRLWQEPKIEVSNEVKITGILVDI